jgi:phosphate starvation-inducible protein PhoH and related proteins
MDEETLRSLPLDDLPWVDLFGEQDRHLRAIEQRFGVRLLSRGGQLTVRGARTAVDAVVPLLTHLAERVRRGEAITDEDLGYAAAQVDVSRPSRTARPAEITSAEVVLVADRRVVKVRSAGQSDYVRAMRSHEIVFAIGPAGTGKTYLAVAAAVHALKEKQIERIVLVRPAVEAGERLGFLPGDLQEKVDPYLRPLYDALREMMSFEKLQRLLQLAVVEVAPLAYMRGRTLPNAWVILDEAQNTTLPQMKMFLTRLGPGSRAVITGDITQIDLEDPAASGLICVRPILEGIRGIAFAELSDRDVARHPLVRDIIQAFAERDRSRDGTPAP